MKRKGRQHMKVIWVIAVALAAGILAAAAPASRPPTVLATRDTTQPYTSIAHYAFGDEGDKTYNRYGVRVVIPGRRVQVTVDVSIECHNEDGSVERERTYTVRKLSPFTVWRPAAMRNAYGDKVIVVARRSASAGARPRMVVTLLGA